MNLSSFVLKQALLSKIYCIFLTYVKDDNIYYFQLLYLLIVTQFAAADLNVQTKFVVFLVYG